MNIIKTLMILTLITSFIPLDTLAQSDGVNIDLKVGGKGGLLMDSVKDPNDNQHMSETMFWAAVEIKKISLSNSIYLVIKTPNETRFRVKWGPNGNLDQGSLVEYSAKTNHLILIEDLNPGQNYSLQLETVYQSKKYSRLIYVETKLINNSFSLLSSTDLIIRWLPLISVMRTTTNNTRLVWDTNPLPKDQIVAKAEKNESVLTPNESRSYLLLQVWQEIVRAWLRLKIVTI